MVTVEEAAVRSAVEQDRRRLSNLVHFETYVHRHLDWRTPIDWLGEQPYLVAERAGRIIGALACPQDPPGIAWIRVFAAQSQLHPEEVWKVIWPKAQVDLKGQAGKRVAAIPLHKWFRILLEKEKFNHSQDVVMLAWDGEMSPPAQPQVQIRAMAEADLPAVHQIDKAAFDPLWQNSLASLELAYKQRLHASIAQQDSQIVGYQISTSSPFGVHMARLAVHPEAQKAGTGYALVKQLLDQCSRRANYRVSVNTQRDNGASLALYRKAGFKLTGEGYPVYLYELS